MWGNFYPAEINMYWTAGFMKSPGYMEDVKTNSMGFFSIITNCRKMLEITWKLPHLTIYITEGAGFFFYFCPFPDKA